MARKNLSGADKQHCEAAWRIAVGLAKASELEVVDYMIHVAPKVYEEILATNEDFSAEGFIKLHTRLFGNGKVAKGKLLNILNEALEFDFVEIQIGSLVAIFSKFIFALYSNKSFSQGNLITCAVFFIKYLQLLGFDYLNAKPFERDSLYFRLAIEAGDIKSLSKFIENFVFSKNNKLSINKSFKNNSGSAKMVSALLPSNTEIAVLDAIKKNPEITQEELAKQVKKSVRTVKTVTKDLSDKGFITRQNGKRYGRWIVL